IRFALSRRREFLADAGSVELTKNPDAMITALRKIEGRGELEGATSAVMELCVDNPREGFVDLFATHPPVAKRVTALVQFAGGRAAALEGCRPGPGRRPSRLASRAPQGDGNDSVRDAPQCDISTGTVIDWRMPRVAPPRMNSRRREWP